MLFDELKLFTGELGTRDLVQMGQQSARTNRLFSVLDGDHPEISGALIQVIYGFLILFVLIGWKHVQNFKKFQVLIKIQLFLRVV